MLTCACADPEGGRGSRHPLENHKAIGFLSNTGPDPLENHKANKLPMLGNYRPTSKTPFKWRFGGGPMMTCFKWYLDPLSPHLLKKFSELSWTHSDKTFWIRACCDTSWLWRECLFAQACLSLCYSSM